MGEAFLFYRWEGIGKMSSHLPSEQVRVLMSGPECKLLVGSMSHTPLLLSSCFSPSSEGWEYLKNDITMCHFLCNNNTP
jgi:hypothetical protein